MEKIKGSRVSRLHIPDDVTFNILKRLSAKSLMRFKSVCKSWNSLICDPCFADCHHIRSQTRPDASYILFYLFRPNYKALALFPTNSEKASLSNQLPVHKLYPRFIPCTNVVNGLICLCSPNNLGLLHLLNVTTGEKIALPPGKRCHVFGYRQLHRPHYHLGFDPVTKKYKLLYFHKDTRTNIIIQCLILTIGSKSWRAIDCPEPPILSGTTISVDGAIYWKDKTFISGKKVVLYFDIGEEKFGAVAAPPETDGTEGTTTSLIQLGMNVAFLSIDNKSRNWMSWSLNKADQVWVKDEKYFKDSFLGYWDCVDRIIGTTNTGEVMLTVLKRRKPWYFHMEEEKHGRSEFYDMETGKSRTTSTLTLPRLPVETTNWDPVLGDVAASNQVENIGDVAATHHVENILPLRSLCE
ncbi:F-box protein At5g65850-like [Coffea arabica]|uniref:F-box protein At5g65850-like n=1 Tax=Coffea arabica TaxID=13443 RepID=A0A6P6X199_COFAR|nr:F-box protein At4g19940-like [Coffea arabica]